MSIDRRTFLQLSSRVAGAVAVGALFGCGGGASSTQFGQSQSPAPGYPSNLPALPGPADSGVDHVVVVMMENRSFDHLLGWLPGADGMQSGLSYPDTSGKKTSTFRLGTNYRGCGYNDPAHNYDTARQEYDLGKMDGFLRTPGNDIFCIGYYAEEDLPFHASLARNFTTCSRYFSSFLGPTWPNRLFLHSAQTDRLNNDGPTCTMPTIWDRLGAAGVSANYYYSNFSFLDNWGGVYNSFTRPTSQFYSDAASGQLPAVTFLEPGWSTNGDNDDEHPHANLQRGEHFLWKVYSALTTSPLWSKLLLVVTYDEGGGFFEHIVPPRVSPGNSLDTDMINGKVLLGFRVPTLVISPFSTGTPDTPRISSVLYDHTSILKFIEWRWGLPALTTRDGGSDIYNLAYALNYSSKDITLRSFAEPPMPTDPPSPCP